MKKTRVHTRRGKGLVAGIVLIALVGIASAMLQIGELNETQSIEVKDSTPQFVSSATQLAAVPVGHQATASSLSQECAAQGAVQKVQVEDRDGVVIFQSGGYVDLGANACVVEFCHPDGTSCIRMGSDQAQSIAQKCDSKAQSVTCRSNEFEKAIQKGKKTCTSGGVEAKLDFCRNTDPKMLSQAAAQQLSKLPVSAAFQQGILGAFNDTTGQLSAQYLVQQKGESNAMYSARLQSYTSLKTADEDGVEIPVLTEAEAQRLTELSHKRVELYAQGETLPEKSYTDDEKFFGWDPEKAKKPFTPSTFNYDDIGDTDDAPTLYGIDGGLKRAIQARKKITTLEEKLTMYDIGVARAKAEGIIPEHATKLPQNFTSPKCFGEAKECKRDEKWITWKRGGDLGVPTLIRAVDMNAAFVRCEGDRECFARVGRSMGMNTEDIQRFADDMTLASYNPFFVDELNEAVVPKPNTSALQKSSLTRRWGATFGSLAKRTQETVSRWWESYTGGDPDDGDDSEYTPVTVEDVEKFEENLRRSGVVSSDSWIITNLQDGSRSIYLGDKEDFLTPRREYGTDFKTGNEAKDFLGAQWLIDEGKAEAYRLSGVIYGGDCRGLDSGFCGDTDEFEYDFSPKIAEEVAKTDDQSYARISGEFMRTQVAERCKGDERCIEFALLEKGVVRSPAGRRELARDLAATYNNSAYAELYGSQTEQKSVLEDARGVDERLSVAADAPNFGDPDDLDNLSEVARTPAQIRELLFEACAGDEVCENERRKADALAAAEAKLAEAQRVQALIDKGEWYQPSVLWTNVITQGKGPDVEAAKAEYEKARQAYLESEDPVHSGVLNSTQARELQTEIRKLENIKAGATPLDYFERIRRGAGWREKVGTELAAARAKLQELRGQSGVIQLFGAQGRGRLTGTPVPGGRPPATVAEYKSMLDRVVSAGRTAQAQVKAGTQPSASLLAQIHAGKAAKQLLNMQAYSPDGKSLLFDGCDIDPDACIAFTQTVKKAHPKLNLGNSPAFKPAGSAAIPPSNKQPPNNQRPPNQPPSNSNPLSNLLGNGGLQNVLKQLGNLGGGASRSKSGSPNKSSTASSSSSTTNLCAKYPGTVHNKTANKCECPQDQKWNGQKCESSTPGGTNGGTGVVKAELSCAPKGQDLGDPVVIAYACTNAKTATALGFEIQEGALAGSATVKAERVEGEKDAKVRTYVLTCKADNQPDAKASCDVVLNEAKLSAVSVPNPVVRGKAARIGWVTTGITSCTVDSPGTSSEAKLFTEAHKELKRSNAITKTPPLSDDLEVRVRCTTRAGNTKEARWVIEVTD